MKKKIALFLGLLLAANVCYAELKIGFVNIPAVLEKAPQAEKAKKTENFDATMPIPLADFEQTARMQR